LGVTLEELGRLDESEASCRQAVVLKPDYAEAHSNLGVTLQKLGRLDEAEEIFKKAINLKTGYRNAILGLGQVLMLKGQHKEGLTHIRQGNGAIFFDFDNDNWVLIE
jgi:Flp pilus assembly protein TadD